MQICQNTVKYLGHIVGEGQQKSAEAKIKAITELQPPKAKTEIRRCLGMARILLALYKELCLDSRTAYKSAKREKQKGKGNMERRNGKSV